LAVVNVTNRADVHVRFRAFKLFLSHFTWALNFEGPNRPGPTSRAMYLEMVWKSRGLRGFGAWFDFAVRIVSDGQMLWQTIGEKS
ncbi:MAG: hypothetical protein AAFP85_18485, partial [Pseudomonadota bacterium]